MAVTRIDGQLVNFFNIDDMVHKLAALPNVFVVSFFDCCQENKHGQSSE
jgi:hypothetical protein